LNPERSSLPHMHLRQGILISKMQDARCKIQENFNQRPCRVVHQAPYMFMSFVVSLLILLLTSCGGKEVKPVSPESKSAQEAIVLAETIRNAYIKNDRETIEKHSTSDGYGVLIGMIKSFDSAELTFTPTWVEVENSNVSLHVSWKGTWVVGGKRTEERGIAVFVLEGRPLKLARVKRENPFRQPE